MAVLPSLGEQEIEIFRYVSQNGEVSVREVAEYFEKHKGLARTTILTVMERLRKKGYIAREQVDGIYKYSEKIKTETVMRGKVSEFVERTLGGSLGPLINHFAGSKDLSSAEIEQLRELVNAFDKKTGAK